MGFFIYLIFIYLFFSFVYQDRINLQSYVLHSYNNFTINKVWMWLIYKSADRIDDGKEEC